MRDRVVERFAVWEGKKRELEFEHARSEAEYARDEAHQREADAQMLEDLADVAEKSGERPNGVVFLRDIASQVRRGRPISRLSGPQQKWLDSLVSRWRRKIPDLHAARKREEAARVEMERARLEAEKAEDLELKAMRDLRDLKQEGWRQLSVDDFALQYREADYVAEIDGEPKWSRYSLRVMRDNRLLLTREGSDPEDLGRIGVGFIVKSLIGDATKLLQACEEQGNIEGAVFAKRVLRMLQEKKRLPGKHEQGFLRGLEKLDVKRA